MVPWYLVNRQLTALGCYPLKCLALRAAEDRDGGGYEYRTRKVREGWWSVRHTGYWLIRADLYDRLRTVKRRRARALKSA